MNEQPPRRTPRPSKPPVRAAAARRRLFRRVLSLGVAAIVAAWLPFSVIYISALNRHATPVVAVSAARNGGATRVVTTASGATRVVSAGGSASSTAPAAVTPVSTHTS